MRDRVDRRDGCERYEMDVIDMRDRVERYEIDMRDRVDRRDGCDRYEMDMRVRLVDASERQEANRSIDQGRSRVGFPQRAAPLALPPSPLRPLPRTPSHDHLSLPSIMRFVPHRPNSLPLTSLPFQSFPIYPSDSPSSSITAAVRLVPPPDDVALALSRSLSPS